MKFSLKKIFSDNNIDFYEKKIYSFGTSCDIIAYGSNAKIAIKESVEKLRHINDRFSAFDKNSEISKINVSNEVEFKISEDTFYVIKKSIEYSILTAGNFDITMEPLVNLWSIGSENFKEPNEGSIKYMKSLVGYRKLILDEKKFTIIKESPFQQISLGAIAKGYATDEVKKIMKKNDIHKAIINLGGNIYVLGEKDKNVCWRVGIQNPLEKTGIHMGIVELRNKSIVTSGNYERFSVLDGYTYSHIISPITGHPTTTDMESITIISNESIDGDGLSTGLFILGSERAIAIIENIQDVECICILKDRNVVISSGIKNNFKIIDSRYKIL